MSIHKRVRKSGTRYLVVVYGLNGKQMSKTFKRKIDAVRWETEQKQLINRYPDHWTEILMQKANLRLAEYCQEWVTEYATPNKTPSSVRRDKQMIKNQIVPYLGRFRLNELSQKVVESWKNSLQNRQSIRSEEVVRILFSHCGKES